MFDNWKVSSFGLLFGVICALSIPITATAQGRPLSEKDHTAILKALFENRDLLRRNLGANNKPTAAQILQAMLRVDIIDVATKARIQRVLKVSSYQSEAQTRVLTEDVRDVQDIETRLKLARSSKEVVQTLENVLPRYQQSRRPRLVVGTQLAMKIFRDGESTIYSPKWLSDHKLVLPNRGPQVAGPQASTFGDIWAWLKGVLGADLLGAIKTGSANGQKVADCAQDTTKGQGGSKNCEQVYDMIVTGAVTASVKQALE